MLEQFPDKNKGKKLERQYTEYDDVITYKNSVN
jgi:hypothetical protein